MYRSHDHLRFMPITSDDVLLADVVSTAADHLVPHIGNEGSTRVTTLRETVRALANGDADFTVGKNVTYFPNKRSERLIEDAAVEIHPEDGPAEPTVVFRTKVKTENGPMSAVQVALVRRQEKGAKDGSRQMHPVDVVRIGFSKSNRSDSVRAQGFVDGSTFTIPGEIVTVPEYVRLSYRIQDVAKAMAPIRR